MALLKYSNDLKNQDTRMEALNDIKQQLTSARGDDITEYANSIQLPLIFDCLENENEEQVDLACDILTICMENLNLGESLVRYSNALEKSLTHKHDAVRQMSLKEILRAAEKNVVFFNDICRKSLILRIIDCVAHDNISVANVAVNILCLILIPWLRDDQILAQMRNVMECGEIQRFRVYEILTQLASRSKDNFNQIESTSLLSNMLGELNVQDELLQLNLLELLTQLALCDHGFTYLESKGVLNHFAVQVENIDKSPLSHLVLPGLLKFFGRVAHHRPADMLNQYKNILFKIFGIVLNSYDETLLLVSLDTIGYLGATREGKLALNNNNDEKMSALLKQVGAYIQSGSTELRLRSLDCLRHLVGIEPTDIHNNELQTITQKWFNMMNDNSIELLFSICKKPFPDIKIAALSVFKVIAGQLWGADLIINNPGIIEYLLDRRTENFKDGKQVKYDIIFALNQLPDLDSDIKQRLHHYVMEGPFYVETVMEVAIEGE